VSNALPRWSCGRGVLACLLLAESTVTCGARGGLFSAESVAADGGMAGGDALGSAPTYVPPPYDAAALERARALCAGPLGPPDPVTNDDGFRARAIGAWFYCGPTKPTDTTPTSGTGLELASDGYWYNLVNDGDGGVARDPKNRGSYRLSLVGPAAAIILENTATLDEIAFRSGPREMISRSDSAATYAWMVAFGQ
jgi:hypothetical protein